MQRALRGGYPEAAQRGTADGRFRWFEGYLAAMIQRDLRELSAIAEIHQVPRLLGLVAARAGSTLNMADLAQNLGMNLMTVKRYLALFEALYRTSQGEEVDLVLETRRRELIGIGVKASATLQASDFKGLRQLQALVGERFKAGIVLYAGPELLPFGPGLWAVPFQALWAAKATG